MLRVSPGFILLVPGGPENERTTMGNVAIAEELPGVDDLDELYRLDASESEPEDDDEDDDEDDEDDEGIEPETIPQG
jgi:hypothetical protein